MLESEVNIMQERELRNLLKGDDYRGTNWFRRLYSLKDLYLESKLQKSNLKVDIVQSINMSQLHLLRQDNLLRPNLKLNTSRESRFATEYRKTNCSRRK